MIRTIFGLNIFANTDIFYFFYSFGCFHIHFRRNTHHRISIFQNFFRSNRIFRFFFSIFQSNVVHVKTIFHWPRTEQRKCCHYIIHVFRLQFLSIGTQSLCRKLEYVTKPTICKIPVNLWIVILNI